MARRWQLLLDIWAENVKENWGWWGRKLEQQGGRGGKERGPYLANEILHNWEG